ncbi:MAG: hypothetical protein HYX24_01595 [Candidatus Aenigmarchaeota archaeon]|nr:hypothetical protein [Candidatus Aenigmarchaeota archaeon]
MSHKFIYVATIAALLIGLYAGTEFFPKAVYVEKPVEKVVERIVASKMGSKGSEAVIQVPAVDTQGKGVASRLRVIALPGQGRVLADINSVLFFTDTQNSIRVSRKVAENVTGINIHSYDIIYAMETNASFIEGPSAGAALTLATIAALENRTIRQSTMITGSINEDGTIGLAGGIEEKAKAAKAAGAKLFVIPSEYYFQTIGHEKKFECRMLGGINYCETSYVAKDEDLSSRLGMDTARAKDIWEAMGYFIE